VTAHLLAQLTGQISFRIFMDKEPLLNRLLSGIVIFKIKGICIQVKPATVEDKALADFYAQEIYEDALLDTSLTNKDVEQLLLDNNWWTKEEGEALETMNKNLEQMKLDYYNNFFKPDTRDYIQKSITNLEKKINDLYNKKYEFFDKTCEYLRDYSRTCFLVERSSFLLDGTPAITRFSLLTLVNKYMGGTIRDEKIRELCKTNQWRSIWNSKDFGVFKNSVCELTNEQLSLLAWSRYYDSVYESMDRPNHEIIQNNTALDGWFIEQDRKRAEEEKKADGEKLVSDKMSNAGEVFIPVKSNKEKESVLALNDTYGKAVLKSKKSQFSKGGSFNESELNHVKREIQIEGARQIKERGK
jgi:hypothetical protein